MSADAELLTTRVTVDALNNEKYDNVSRIAGKEIGGGAIGYQLDLNTDLWPVSVGDSLTMCIATSLNLDGSKDDGKGWRDSNKAEATLADDYDYVCHGKIYRFEEGKGDDINVYISFGGLLMYLHGPFEKLKAFRMDSVYLLLKK
ncbi:uncharacterized protein HMPREF1541_03772 [Cyphellophora europaea CBS 101466]|uniref:DNA-directed RNA polymerases I, II, and III subunit RPABC3 n=1 Tax=Cyphellophora europaea (strain CBS 101466) TaxID=1220924 RepID=W2RZR1_CYPE1|nr:uncharacterized protein HMPREF1541_03772 [Cyphellophora europaea CBS 101466]ETN41835.1 hypothetical protein HMPREF1541_03772 [Cyphellophora europaea CBS 101466]